MKLGEGLLTVSQYEKGTEDIFLKKLEYSGCFKEYSNFYDETGELRPRAKTEESKIDWRKL